jgi:hypothetical protein
VGLLAASHAVGDIYQGAVPALLPFFIAATALSSVIQPVFGALTDRRNLRWLVPAGLTVAGAGIGLSGLAASYPLTWLAIALSGVRGGRVPPGGGPGGPGRQRRQPAGDERVLRRRQRRLCDRAAVRRGGAGLCRHPRHPAPGRARAGHRHRRVHRPAA